MEKKSNSVPDKERIVAQLSDPSQILEAVGGIMDREFNANEALEEPYRSILRPLIFGKRSPEETYEDLLLIKDLGDFINSRVVK